MAKTETDATADETTVSLSEKRAEKDELASFLEDVEAGTEAEWESVYMPEWKGRTVLIRSLTSGERARLRREGYETAKNKDGEMYLKETGELEPLLVQMACYAEIGGKKQRLFKDGAGPRALLKRQRGGALDRLVEVALRLSGLSKKAEEEAKEDFLGETPSSGFDSESPETWE